MKLIVLGSGTSVPHPKRSSSAYWLDTGSGSVLLDCSAPSIHRMAQEGLDWANLDAIWISHFHLDHCGGLAPFLFGTKHAPDMQERTKPLKIFGARGLRALIKGFDDAGGYRLLKQPFPLEIVEVEPWKPFEMAGVEAVAFKTPHTRDSLALRLSSPDGKSLFYTADTGVSNDLAAAAHGVDLLLMECSFVKNKPVEKHLELSEAIALIRGAAPRRSMLSHLYAEWDDVDFAAQVARHDPPCEVIEARDGLRIEI